MTQLTNYAFADITLGTSEQYTKTLTADDIVLFAHCSGDVNPVHLDAQFAANTVFGEPIGHGMWIGSLVSAAIAMRLPGPGSIYRSQSLQFKKPVKINDEVTVTLTVSEIKERLRLVVLDCVVHNQEGILLAKGVAEVIAPAEAGSIKAPVLPVINIVRD